MKKKLVLIVLLVNIFLFFNLSAQERELIAGSDYQILDAKESNKPQVVEYFNYACSACYSMEPFTASMMRKKKGLSIGFIPMANHPSWRIYVEAFYIGQMTGVLNKSHHAIYHLVQVEKKPFNNNEDMKLFFLSLGVSELEYDKISSSKELQDKVNAAQKNAIKNQINVTPTFVVNNKYKLNTSTLGTYEMLEKAWDQLSGFKK